MMNFFFKGLSLLLCSSVTFSLHDDQHCRLHDFPVRNQADTEVCLVDNLGNKPERTVDPNIDMSSFVRYPSHGQRLILVPRDADLTIRLDDNVAYQLRQRQQVHSISSEDVMAVPLQMLCWWTITLPHQRLLLQHRV